MNCLFYYKLYNFPTLKTVLMMRCYVRFWSSSSICCCCWLFVVATAAVFVTPLLLKGKFSTDSPLDVISLPLVPHSTRAGWSFMCAEVVEVGYKWWNVGPRLFLFTSPGYWGDSSFEMGLSHTQMGFILKVFLTKDGWWCISCGYSYQLMLCLWSAQLK